VSEEGAKQLSSRARRAADAMRSLKEWVSARFGSLQSAERLSSPGDLPFLVALSARADALVVSASPSPDAKPPPSFAGRGFFEAVHVADRPALLSALETATRQREPCRLRLRLRLNPPDSGFTWAEAGVQPADGEAGGPVALAVIRPLGQDRYIEQTSEPANDSMSPETWKDRFLANVSHELRTPLNAILGFSELLADAELAPRDAAKRREYAGIIHDSAAHLLSLVNLVLDTSKLEAGKFELSPEAFALPPLIAASCDMLRLKAETGGVELICQPAVGVADIVADKRACKQILINLLSNAVKFTPPGGKVRVEARAFGSEVRICVEDNGVGIAEQHLVRLGEPFFQARADYDRDYEGAGLGLSLVRGLVGLHGGALLIESAPGRGTRATVRLPLDCRGAERKLASAARIETLAQLSQSLKPVEALNQPERKIA